MMNSWAHRLWRCTQKASSPLQSHSLKASSQPAHSHFKGRRPYAQVVCFLKHTGKYATSGATVPDRPRLHDHIVFPHVDESRWRTLTAQTKTISVRSYRRKKGKRHNILFLHRGCQWAQSRLRHGVLKQRATLRFFVSGASLLCCSKKHSTCSPQNNGPPAR